MKDHNGPPVINSLEGTSGAHDLYGSYTHNTNPSSRVEVCDTAAGIPRTVRRMQCR